MSLAAFMLCFAFLCVFCLGFIAHACVDGYQEDRSTLVQAPRFEALSLLREGKAYVPISLEATQRAQSGKRPDMNAAHLAVIFGENARRMVISGRDPKETARLAASFAFQAHPELRLVRQGQYVGPRGKVVH